jgi:hypothetical protein
MEDGTRIEEAGMGRRRRALAALVVIALGGGAAAAGPAGAAATRHTALAAGVAYWRDTFTTANGATVRAVLVSVDLRVKGVSLDPASYGEMIGGPHRRLTGLADGTHAVAGVNGDFFSFDDDNTPPKGGMIRAGRILKTPRPGHQADFWIRADGRAAAGPLTFQGLVRRAAAGTRAAAALPLYSINTLADAAKGRVTLITSDLAGTRLPSGCTVVTGGTTKGVRRVAAVRVGVRGLSRLPSGNWALAACGGTRAAQLRSTLAAGDPITISASFAQGAVRSLISGGALLVNGGAAHTDPTRVGVQGRNPETFACLSRDGRTVTLGAIDGRSRRSAGVSFRSLTAYLLGLHCWSGLAFDGGGSTEMVARLVGHTRSSVLNVPSDGEERPVPNGLFVYKR